MSRCITPTLWREMQIVYNNCITLRPRGYGGKLHFPWILQFLGMFWITCLLYRLASIADRVPVFSMLLNVF